jgi:hypothetical protein
MQHSQIYEESVLIFHIDVIIIFHVVSNLWYRLTFKFDYCTPNLNVRPIYDTSISPSFRIQLRLSTDVHSRTWKLRCWCCCRCRFTGSKDNTEWHGVSRDLVRLSGSRFPPVYLGIRVMILYDTLQLWIQHSYEQSDAGLEVDIAGSDFSGYSESDK